MDVASLILLLRQPSMQLLTDAQAAAAISTANAPVAPSDVTNARGWMLRIDLRTWRDQCQLAARTMIDSAVASGSLPTLSQVQSACFPPQAVVAQPGLG